MDDGDGRDIDALVELLAACHRVQAHIPDHDDPFARALSEICATAERRLHELGIHTEPLGHAD